MPTDNGYEPPTMTTMTITTDIDGYVVIEYRDPEGHLHRDNGCAKIRTGLKTINADRIHLYQFSPMCDRRYYYHGTQRKRKEGEF